MYELFGRINVSCADRYFLYNIRIIFFQLTEHISINDCLLYGSNFSNAFRLSKAISGRPWIQQNIFVLKNVVVDVHKPNKDKITVPSIEAQSQ
jgi:hypothetical protein